VLGNALSIGFHGTLARALQVKLIVQRHRFPKGAAEQYLWELWLENVAIYTHLYYAANLVSFLSETYFLSRCAMLEFLITEESSLRLPKDTMSSPIRV